MLSSVGPPRVAVAPDPRWRTKARADTRLILRDRDFIAELKTGETYRRDRLFVCALTAYEIVSGGECRPSERGAPLGCSKTRRTRALIDHAITVIVFRVARFNRGGLIDETIAVIVKIVTAFSDNMLVCLTITVIIKSVATFQFWGSGTF